MQFLWDYFAIFTSFNLQIAVLFNALFWKVNKHLQISKYQSFCGLENAKLCLFSFTQYYNTLLSCFTRCYYVMFSSPKATKKIASKNIRIFAQAIYAWNLVNKFSHITQQIKKFLLNRRFIFLKRKNLTKMKKNTTTENNSTVTVENDFIFFLENICVKNHNIRDISQFK